MPRNGTVTVDLPTDFVSRVREHLEGSSTLSDDQVIYDALQDWQSSKAAPGENTEWLREAWAEATNDVGPYSPAEEVFARLRARYQKKVDEQSLGK